MPQVLRRKLKECYRTEGIDHLTQCKEVRNVVALQHRGRQVYRGLYNRRTHPLHNRTRSHKSTWRPSRAWASTRPTLARMTRPPGPRTSNDGWDCTHLLEKQ